MSESGDDQLPQDEHLRDDISVPSPDTETTDEHLQDDINTVDEERESGADFSEERYTSGQLNAGVRVPGVSPEGEYAKGRKEELGGG